MHRQKKDQKKWDIFLQVDLRTLIFNFTCKFKIVNKRNYLNILYIKNILLIFVIFKINLISNC